MTPCRASSRVALRRCAGPAGRRPGGGKARPDTPRGTAAEREGGAEIHCTCPDGAQEPAAESSPARDDPLRTWRSFERNARRGQGHRKIRLAETGFRGHPAVVREYPFTLRASRATPACWASPRTERRTGSTRGTGRRPKRRRRRRTGRPRTTSRCSGAQGAGARGHTRRGPRPRHRESPSAGTPSRAPARAAPPSPRPARCCFTKATASTRAATSSDNSTVVRPLCSVSVSM